MFDFDDLAQPGILTALLRSLRSGVRFRGEFVADFDRRVTADGEVLDPRPSQRLWNHSPDGFNWGYWGSGPAQLALALLLHIGCPDDLAVALHQPFKRAYVSTWGQRNGWQLSGAAIVAWVGAELRSRVAEARGAADGSAPPPAEEE